jgi:putative flippase GtrA
MSLTSGAPSADRPGLWLRFKTSLASLTRVFIRYLGVQAVGYAIDMGIFLVLIHATAPLYANLISKTVAVVFGFFANRYFTFRIHGIEHGRSQLIKYAVIAALNIPIANLLFQLLTLWLSPLALAKFVADVLCMGMNFLLSHYVVFRQPARPGKT